MRDGITTEFSGAVTGSQVSVIGSEMREHLFAAGLNPRQRAMLELVLEFLRERGIAEHDARIYGHEAITPMAMIMRGRFPRYVGTEYATDEAARARLFPILHGDICQSEWPDSVFDLVLSADTLEHVPLADAALRETARILRKGGRLIAIVPVPVTWQQESVRFAELLDGRLTHLQKPIYHGNPADPEGGSLVYEIPGWDILQRARSAGFSDARMLLWADARRGIVASHLDSPIPAARRVRRVVRPLESDSNRPANIHPFDLVGESGSSGHFMWLPGVATSA